MGATRKNKAKRKNFKLSLLGSACVSADGSFWGDEVLCAVVELVLSTRYISACREPQQQFVGNLFHYCNFCMCVVWLSCMRVYKLNHFALNITNLHLIVVISTLVTPTWYPSHHFPPLDATHKKKSFLTAYIQWNKLPMNCSWGSLEAAALAYRSTLMTALTILQ